MRRKKHSKNLKFFLCLRFSFFRIELVNKYRRTIPEPLPFSVEPALKAVSYADYKALFMICLSALGLTLISFIFELSTSRKEQEKRRSKEAWE